MGRCTVDQDKKDDIKSIVAGKHRFVFCKRDPLYILAISNKDDPSMLLAHQVPPTVATNLTACHATGLVGSRAAMGRAPDGLHL